ncbi:MAG: hypothetical protein VB131_07695 [Burkholderia gladioli]
MSAALNFLQKALPWIGAAATGNVPMLVGLAAQSVGDALGIKVDAEPQAIAGALAGATPEQLAAVRRADQDFALKMQELGFKDAADLARIDADDRTNARNREIAAHDTLTPRALACFVTSGFFGALGYLLIEGKSPNGGDALLVMLGALGTAWTAIVGYYFGSSAGSASKNQIMASKMASPSEKVPE